MLFSIKQADLTQISYSFHADFTQNTVRNRSGIVAESLRNRTGIVAESYRNLPRPNPCLFPYSNQISRRFHAECRAES